MEPTKQILVMRKDLGMRAGKMCAQAAHASMGAVLPYLGLQPVILDPATRTCLEHITEWLANSFTKICVRVDSEEELVAIYEKAVEADLITCLITDNGRTEFQGVPTKTCCAIGPATDAELKPITGELKLL